MMKKKYSTLEIASWIAAIVGTLITIITFTNQNQESGSSIKAKDINNVTQINGDVTINNKIDNDEDELDDEFIHKGIDLAFNEFKDTGISGLQQSVEKCYKEINKKSSIDDVKV